MCVCPPSSSSTMEHGETECSSLEEPLLPTGSSDDDDDVTPSCPGESPNIFLVKIFTLFAFAGRSIWNMNVLATLVFLLTNGNPEAVGYITAAMGLAQMLISFPTGYIADRYNRRDTLRVGSLFGLGAIAMTIFAAHKSSYVYLVIALTCWGFYWGIVNTAIGALFADSINDGDRAKHFTSRNLHLQAGNVVGPLICLVMFLSLGDEWTVQDCTTVLIVGQIVSLPGVLLLWFLKNDKHAAANDTAAPVHQEQSQHSAIESESEVAPEASNQGCCGLPSHRIIPVCVAVSDVMAGFASGMSIRYIAIFLYDNIGLAPAAVQVIYIMCPLCQSVLMKLAECIAKKHGRCRTTVAFKWIGISLMVLMILSYLGSLPRWIICGLLALRTGFMNSTRALTKSLVMDTVPRSERAKWSALESVNMFSWSGSAVLGGFLVGFDGIIFNFCVTAVLQVIATFPLIALFSLEDRLPTVQPEAQPLFEETMDRDDSDDENC